MGKNMAQIAIVHPNAAGLDIGSREIWGCVPPDRDGETAQPFGTFTPDLQRLADWLVKCGVDTVATQGLPGKCSTYEERARPQIRCPRLPMDTEVARIRITHRVIPT